MKPRRHDPIMAAILAQLDAVDAVLGQLRVPAHARDDVRQEVLIQTHYAAWRGRVAWRYPPALGAFLRVVAARAVADWWKAHPPTVELTDEHEAVVPSAEGAVIARSMLRFMRRSTTPERWRALRAFAKGIPGFVIAQREGVSTASIFTRIRLAREDIAAALARDDAAIFIRRRK
jgi:DNA-directed RNA polymerase specialized sigma24 family protein